MHEISIAICIIDIAEARAREAKCGSIQIIRIRLGEFTTIAREALEFAFDVARQGTLAENATLEIESVPMVAYCVTCGPVKDPMRGVCLTCQECGLPLAILSGKELEVESIEVESNFSGHPKAATSGNPLGEDRHIQSWQGKG